VKSSNQAIQLRHGSFRRLITYVPNFHTTLKTISECYQQIYYKTGNHQNEQLLTQTLNETVACFIKLRILLPLLKLIQLPVVVVVVVVMVVEVVV